MLCRSLVAALRCRSNLLRARSCLVLHALPLHPPPSTTHLIICSSSPTFATSPANTVLLYENTNTKSKFFRLIFIMSAVQLVFWTYLSYFAFVELRQDKLCRVADRKHPPSQDPSSEEVVVDPTSPPWYSSLRWRLGISLFALSLGVFFGVTACMYPLRVVQMLHYVRRGGLVHITTYSPFKGTRIVEAPLEDIGLVGSRKEVKGRQVGMKVKGHRLFFLLDREGTFTAPAMFDTLVGSRRY